jgi:hypothetical protein
MMGLDTPETCRGWRNILRIICLLSWFFFILSQFLLGVVIGITCRGHHKRSYFTVNTKQLMFCSTIIAIYFEKNYIKLINVLRGIYGVFLDININGACNTGFKYWSMLFKFMARLIWILIVGANDKTEGDNEDCVSHWKP